MVTRIIMDKDVGEKYLKGGVFDSRIPLDAPAGITQDRLDFFIAQGWAHEESDDEYWARIDLRRKATLADPKVDEETKQLIRQQNAFAAAALPVIEAVAAFRPQPTRGAAPQNPATLLAAGENL